MIDEKTSSIAYKAAWISEGYNQIDKAIEYYEKAINIATGKPDIQRIITEHVEKIRKQYNNNELTDSEESDTIYEESVTIDTWMTQPSSREKPPIPSSEEKEPILEEEVVRTIESHFGMPFEELQAIVEERRRQLEWKRAEAVGQVTKISPDELRSRSGYYLDKVDEEVSYSIVRHNVEVARLMPYDEMCIIEKENVITASDINKRLGMFLDETRKGKTFIVQRGKQRVAVLTPPPTEERGVLSEDGSLKLIATASLTAEETRKAVNMMKLLRKQQEPKKSD